MLVSSPLDSSHRQEATCYREERRHIMPVLADEWSSFSKVDNNTVQFLFYDLY
jgi:hypothetical protein